MAHLNRDNWHPSPPLHGTPRPLETVVPLSEISLLMLYLYGTSNYLRAALFSTDQRVQIQIDLAINILPDLAVNIIYLIALALQGN